MGSILLNKDEVFVYRIPHLTNIKGYKATDWNIAKPDFTGKLKIVEFNNVIKIRIEDRGSGELFAEAPVTEYPGSCVTNTLDSSRFFVIKIVNEQRQHAFVGMGFTARSDAFDFTVTLQDYFQKEKKLQDLKAKQLEKSDIDLKLKQGESIRLNIPKSNKKQNKTSLPKGVQICKVPIPGSNNDSLSPISESNQELTSILSQPTIQNNTNSDILDLNFTNQSYQPKPISQDQFLINNPFADFNDTKPIESNPRAPTACYFDNLFGNVDPQISTTQTNSVNTGNQNLDKLEELFRFN